MLRETYQQHRQSKFNVTSRRVRVTIVAVEKQRIKHSTCVFVALVIQEAKRMRQIILSSMINGTIFGENVMLHKMRILSFSAIFL